MSNQINLLERSSVDTMPTVNNITLEQLTAAKEVEKEHDAHKTSFPLPPLRKEKGSRKRKTTGKKICSTDECNNLAIKNGVCWRHGAKDLVEKSAKKKKKTANDDKSTQKTVSRNPSKKTASTLHPPIGNSISAKKSSNQTALLTGGNLNPSIDQSSTESTPSWEEMFYKLVLFQANNNGSTIVPFDEEHMALSKWAANERMLWRLSLRGQVLTQEETNHMKALEQIGFLFEARTSPVNNTAKNAATWTSRFQEMIEYERANGTYHPGNKNEVPLARWVEVQRNAYKEYQKFLRMFAKKYPRHPTVNPEDIASRKDTSDPKHSGMILYITKERIDKLKALDGFKLETVAQVPFEERLSQYTQFQNTHGHGFVPQHYKNDRNLGKWVNKIRLEYKYYREGKKSSMTPERLAQLEAINFEFCYGDPRGIKSKEVREMMQQQEHEHVVDEEEVV